MTRTFFRLLACVLLLLCAAQAQAGTRTALVVGNSAYPFGPLANPANDAKLIAETLTKTGFEVTTVLDANKVTLQKALLDFSRDIRTKDTVGLLYYAGHGVQVNGANYLIPVDADITSESEVKIFGINVDEFISTLERADGRTNIVILDSCRNNPFSVTARSISRGMALPDAPAGTFVALSTSPGAVALDGEGANSPYAIALAQSILEPDMSIEQAFKVTRRLVLQSTKQQQVPWETSSLTGDFYFVPKVDTPAPVVAVAPAPKVEEQVAVSEPPPIAPDATADGSYRTLEIDAKAFPVGKWPEGLVMSGGFLWVAESGDRRIAQLDPVTGSVLERINVGRLPLNMTADPDNNIYTAVLTDGKVYKQPPAQKGKAIAKFDRPIYIQGLSYGNGAVYAASYAEVENRQTVISRIDPNTGKRTDSKPAGAEPRAFVMAQDSPWLLDASGMVTMYEKDSLQPRDSIANDGFLWSIGANLDAVFVGGRTGQQSGKSIIYRYAQGNPQDRIVQMLDSEELIVAIAANNDRVAALGDGGSYWILDAISLKPLKVIKTGRRPQAAVFDNARLLVTTHVWEADHGAVLAYDNVGAIE